MIRILLLCTLFIAFCSCGSPSAKVATQTVNEQGEIVLALTADTATFTGEINGLSDSKTYLVVGKEGQHIWVKIETDSAPANIRVNQIISPSNEADGPFGNEMSYALKEDGAWKFIVGESLMVGEDYVGEYRVRIAVK